jgi:hypothetical protein
MDASLPPPWVSGLETLLNRVVELNEQRFDAELLSNVACHRMGPFRHFVARASMPLGDYLNRCVCVRRAPQHASRRAARRCAAPRSRYRTDYVGSPAAPSLVLCTRWRCWTAFSGGTNCR